jgi:cytochrome c553
MRTALVALAAAAAAWAADPTQEFEQSIRPVLMQNCAACHNPQSARGPNFLKANTAKDIESERGVWRNVAAQLRNRTMPPVDSKLAEEDRVRISRWVENQLRMTACGGGDYAGAGTIRRLNRREYRNTIRDLIGLDLDLTGVFPNDGTGGAGFDTNGETLYVPPLLMERYMEAAQQILDRAIVTPPLLRSFTGTAGTASVYLDGDYDVIATTDAKDAAAKLTLKVDGADAGTLAPRRGGRGGGAAAAATGPSFALQVKLKRGTHQFAVEGPALTLAISQRREEPSAEKRAMHYRLLGTEPGDEPLQPRKAAQQSLAAFLPRAFRRPIQPAEVNRFMAMYDRAAERGDPYEERVKLALKAVLVWARFPVPRGGSQNAARNLSGKPVRAREPALVFPVVHHAG